MSKKPTAATKRKADDTKQQERIASLQKNPEQAEASDRLEKLIASRKKVTATEPAQEEKALPFEPNVTTPAAEEPKPKRKAVRKAKAEVAAPTGVGDIVAKIEARVSARIDKVHAQQTKALTKDHAATVKQLKADQKESVKQLIAQNANELKAKLAEAEKKAYAAGLKAGEKAATKSITAALKGR